MDCQTHYKKHKIIINKQTKIIKKDPKFVEFFGVRGLLVDLMGQTNFGSCL